MIRYLSFFVLWTVLGLWGCERNGAQPVQTGQGTAPGKMPAEYSSGESLFNSKCAACHGEQAKGTIQGPPLISKIYEPGHHGDPSFHLAVRRGVQAHHWNFGNMPKIEGLGDSEVNEIIAYVRWLQRQAGIF